MSNVVGEAVYKITYDVNTGELKSALDETERTVDKSSKSVEDKQKKAFGTVEKSAAVAGAALGVFAKSAVDVGINFDSAMSKVQAISGATGSDLEALRDKAKEMGRTTKFTASESAEALTYMAMAGWKTQDMLDGLEGIMNLAAASGESLATTSDIVTDALTAFGYKASDSARFADVLAKAASNSNTNVAMMGETFKYAAPLAGALGYQIEDVALASGLMANAGIKASQAGTSLRSIFTRLASPPKEAAKSLNALGVSLTDSSGRMKSFYSVINELRSSFSNLNEVEKTQYASAIAGKNAMSGLLAIVNASEEDYTKLTQAVFNANGASKEMADTMLNNTGGALALLKSNFEGLQLTIAEKLAPALNGIISALSGLVDFLSANQWIFPMITTGISAILALGLATKIAAFGKAILALNPITAGIIIAISVIAGLANLIISNWEGISNFFEGLFASVALIFNFAWEGMVEGARGAWNGIKEVFGNVAAFFGSVFSTAWNTVKRVFSTGGQIFAGIQNGIVSAFKVIVNGIINGINGVVGIPFRGINSALNRLRGINIAGVSPFGWLPNISVPQIPRLATGGIVPSQNGGHVILAGEAGQDEWVVPESKMASLIEQMNARGAGGNITVNVYGTFATSTSEQRKVAEIIAQRLQEVQKSRLGGANI